MNALRSAFERLRSGDDGLSLVELLVTMMIMGVLATVTSVVLNNTTKSARFVQVKTYTTADSRIAMEAMTRSLRVAIIPKGEPSAIVTAGPNSITFYASLARGAGKTIDRPTRVTYDYQSATGCLREMQVEAVNTGVDARPFQWTGASSSKCLIRTFTAPAFDYFDDGLIVRSDGSAVNPVAIPPGGFSDSNSPLVRASIVSIQVALSVQDPQYNDVNGVQARDRVTLANVLTAQNSGG